MKPLLNDVLTRALRYLDERDERPVGVSEENAEASLQLGGSLPDEGLDAAQINQKYSLPRAMGLAVKTFDAWMLADEMAISKAIDMTVIRQRSPENIKDPKQVLHNLIDGASEPRTTVYLLIAEYTNLDTLCERCSEGFGVFHSRLASLVSDVP